MITNYQKHSILQMRRGGMTFAEIGEALDLSSNTVKSVCRRNTFKEQQDGHLPGTVCKNCGEPLKQTPGARRKVFCSHTAAMSGGTAHGPRSPICSPVTTAADSLPATATGNGSSAGGNVICSAVMGRDCPNGQGTVGV